MQIKFIEIQNFRKLKSVRIDFNEDKTLFVGANNSGKTSAMVALGHFLVNQKRFSTNDFTLSNWRVIQKIAEALEDSTNTKEPTLDEWELVLPSLDVWLSVEPNEIHHVNHLLPTLDWNGGLLGVRFRFEPSDIKALKKEYIFAWEAAKRTIKAGLEGSGEKKDYSLSLWPQDFRSFLDRKLRSTNEFT